METQEVVDIELEEKIDSEKNYHLIIWNDDVNTFQWVTDSLMDICGHPLEQAEQLTYFVHYKGKADAKVGDYKTLKSMKDKFIDRSIQATVEKIN